MILKIVWPNTELDSGTVITIAPTLTANIMFSGGVSQGYEAWTGWYSLKSIGRFIVRRVELVHAQYLQNI